MNKIVLLCLTWIISILASGCSSVTPDAGHQAVLIKKPMMFGEGGVDPTPVSSGRTFVAWTTDSVDVSMQPMQYDGEFGDLMSSDGVPLNAHSIIRLQVTDAVMLIKNFGPDWYDNNVKMEFYNRIRQAVRKHGMNETAISTTAIDAIDAEVTSSMQEYLQTAKLPVQLIKITVGKVNPPDAVKNQRIKTAEQQQRQMTEQQTKLAEDQRKMAEESRAAADNAYRTAMQLSPEQYIQLEMIKMQAAVCGGKDHSCTFILGTGATPVIPLK